ncbi:hypothetical protein CLIM01_03792 [Colletotrichum limetticola]|uniref:Uncharacterized protein n=1 Tax=Colletotrichum limetticola TaxID=1209924 RepID=A0ABQ9Q558_9PEZI|nr:hypothetical protein CLIM01_03792 [Colletotrichum limetticola]
MFRPYTRPCRQTIPARRSSNRERTQSRRSRALGFRPARHVRIIHRPKTIGSQAAAVEVSTGKQVHATVYFVLVLTRSVSP